MPGIWLSQLAVALLYALVGKLTLDYFSINGAVSVFWPASGLALAVLLTGGKRYAWGVLLGAVAQNLLTGMALHEAAIIAASNTIEALLGAWLLTRQADFDPAFRRLRDYFRLVVRGGFAACLVSAITGATMLLYAGLLRPGEYFLNLAQWWMGDVLGVVLVAPFVLVCQQPRRWFNQRLGLELVLMLALALLAGQIVFLGWLRELFGPAPMGYLMFPISIWAALRLGLRGVLAAQILVASQGLLGAQMGVGFFANDIAQTQLTNYWFYTMSFSLAGAALAAFTSQHQQAELALLAVKNQLEATLQAIPDLMFELGPDGRYHEVYASSPQLLAAPAADLLGKTVFDVLPAAAAAVVAAALREAHDAGQSHGRQFQLPLAHGDLWFELSVARKPAAPGQVERFIVLSRDISARKSTEQALLQSEANLRSMMDNSPYWTWLKDAAGRYLTVNKVYADYLRLADVRQAVGKTDADFFPQPMAAQCCAEDAEVMASRQQMHVEEMAFDGNLRLWVERYKTPIVDVNGKVLGTVGFASDITARKQAEEELRIAAAAFQSHEAMLITDARGVILRVNRAFIEGTGYAEAEVLGQSPRLLKSGRHDADFYRAMWEKILQTGEWQGEIWDRRKNGEVYPKWLTISAVKDAQGTVTHYIGTHLDISERKKTEQRIEELAFFDQLTGVPNRTYLVERLKQVIAAGSRGGSYGALLFIDLDNFKTLNDTLGHALGDMLLKQVAQRLTQCTREADTVARLGGDEFVVILAGASASEREAAASAEAVAEKILAALNQVYLLGNVAHHSTASIGIALYGGGPVSVDDLMRQADLAMYRSKDAGRNAWHFFDPRMEAAMKERTAWEGDLLRAIKEKQFLLHYQAQVNKGRVSGVEVLVRWQHPRRGLVAPDEFIPLAEETGLILPLGQWVLATACTQLARWAERPALAHLTIAVNVSARQFRQADFVDQVLAALKAAGADPRRLKIELTESLLVENVEDIIAKMSALKARGVGFSLDDFGTGYSSLSYLKRLPLDQLKIDRSFVRDILVDANDATIAKTIMALAQSLGLAVIAEGVETAAQRDFLASLGCHAYQGYLYSRPLPVEGFEQLAVELNMSGGNPASADFVI